jgi:M penetrans paralogue family 26
MSQPQTPLPNATATLVLGICSIVTCFCYGIIGLACGIIALAISQKSVKMYKDDPTAYSGWQNLNAGRICAIIGIILSALYLIFLGVYGVAVFSELQNQGYLNQ